MNQPLREQFPAGCYIGFNAPVNQKSAEQLVLVCGEAVRNGYETVTLCLSSLGGGMEDTFYAVNMLESLPVSFVVYNVGTVQSAANLIFLTGTQRFAVPGATFFFHQIGFEPPPGQQINEAFMTEKLKAITTTDARCETLYLDKTGCPAETVRKWCNTELLMTPELACKNGIIHDVKPLKIPPNAFFHQVVV